MSTETSCHFSLLLQVSKKCLWHLSLCIFFHDFIHIYSPGAGADNPLGTKFWCQQKHLVTSIICCKFQKNLWRFYTIFFMILYMYIAPGQGQTAHRGQSFDVNRKALSLYPFVASSKEVTLMSVFLQFFSWFNTCIQPQGRGADSSMDKVLMSTETPCHFGYLLLVSNHRWQFDLAV